MITIPGDRRNPSWLHKIKFVLDPIGYMESNYKQFGEIFHAPISGNYDPYIWVSHPQAFQKLFSTNPSYFDTVGSVYIKNFIGKDSVVAAEGKRHQRKRKLLLPPFHGEYLDNYGKSIILITNNAVKNLINNQLFLAHHLMQNITLEVILKVIFGVPEKPRIKQLKKAIIAWLEALNSPLISAAILVPSLQINLGSWSPWGKYSQSKQKIAEIIHEEIAERRQDNNDSYSDILSLLMNAKDEQREAMSDEELHDEILGLLFAGHETSAAGLTWAIYQLYKCSNVRKKLLQEIDTLGNNFEVKMIVNLPYLSAVCNETLRMYPPLPKTITRIANQSVNLMGYNLPMGTPVNGSIYLCHHREDLYPNPQEFRPERFLERKFSPYEFIPFGGGTRSCIGQALAILEMKLVLATILARYQLKLLENKTVKPKMRGTTLVPTGGVKMSFQGLR
ncbi:cytochrome P450 [Rippkaea orientalis PCC 8801]|uniref:Cytochrome P450 n=1 Tax=Rippkaea orientalis (strain PCC 8801 / RF-1) TaxID=41431 RepID=B7JW58_RIPO1|nr:cytochrome P450 [Rippkaea orientalis]ACK65747.1 cytochrome P450 [Rippkaea orientalis PCC 8801]